MTIAILVFSEIVPKTIGALYWQYFVTFTAHSLRLPTAGLVPFVWLSQYITRQLKRGTTQPVLTRTDFVAMAELGAQEGVFEEEKSEMIGHLIRFKAIQAGDGRACPLHSCRRLRTDFDRTRRREQSRFSGGGFRPGCQSLFPSARTAGMPERPFSDFRCLDARCARTVRRGARGVDPIPTRTGSRDLAVR